MKQAEVYMVFIVVGARSGSYQNWNELMTIYNKVKHDGFKSQNTMDRIVTRAVVASKHKMFR